MATRTVGLSGGIGSGKSTVAEIFAALGAEVIDADAIVHELQAPGTELLEEIRRAFGDAVIRPDGALDREALGSRVFRDVEARKELERLVHPRVGAEVARRIEAARAADVPLVVLDIPLLFEGRRRAAEAAAAERGSRRPRGGGAATMPFDATVLVWVPRELQIERTVARDGCSRDEAERRIAAQMPLDEKRELADHVIDNSGDREATALRVRELHALLSAAPAGAGISGGST